MINVNSTASAVSLPREGGEPMIRKLLIPTVLVAATLGLAAPATADSYDEADYVSVLVEEGIIPVYYESSDEALNSGYAICDTMDRNGYTVRQMFSPVVDVDHMTYSAAGYVVGAATGALCPWNRE